MKKFLLFLFIIGVMNQHIFSQDKEKSITIQTSPLLLFSDIFIIESDASILAVDLEGQFKITNSTNVSVTLSFLMGTNIMGMGYYYDPEEKAYQIDLRPMYIIRPFDTGIEGFYMGFYPHFGFLYVKDEYEDQLYFEYGFGMTLGYKWVFRNGFTMQLGGGIGKTFSSPEEKNRYFLLNSDGRITIGYTDIHILDFKLGYTF